MARSRECLKVLASQSIPSWNQIILWLKEMETLRTGAIAKMVSQLQSTSGLFEKRIGPRLNSELEQFKEQDANIAEAGQ